jgi:spermidine synthase
VRDKLVMSDTPMEVATNREVVERATGRVLIAGLGLGLILGPIFAKPDVEAVTVVEREPDVIALVGPLVQDPRLEIICADIEVWRPPRGARYETIYFDIWPDIDVANLVQIKRLHRRFRRRLARAPGAWLGSWQYASLLAEVRLGTRRW